MSPDVIEPRRRSLEFEERPTGGTLQGSRDVYNMMSTMRCIFAIISISIVAGSAHAGERASFYVSRQGAEVYDVLVHPERDTALYFPTEVTNASFPSDAGFEIARAGKAVFVRPTKDARGIVNLDVTCQSFQVGILLRVASSPEEATVVAQFHDQDIEDIIRKRVAERMMQKKDELARLIDQRARSLVAGGLLERHERVPVRVIGRTDDHVVVRVQELVWVGSDAYIRFEIQNRGGSPYRLYSIVTLIDGIDRTGALVFPAPESSSLVGLVLPNERQSGIVSVLNAKPWSRDRITLQLSGAAESEEELELRFGLYR